MTKHTDIGLTVLGIDGALNNFGVAHGLVYNNKVIINEIHVLSSKSKKQNKIFNDAKRARQIALFLRQFNYDLVVAEIPYGTKSYSAAWSLGITLGLTASVNVPIIYVTPTEVKRVVRNGATKREIIDWAYAKHPNLQWYKPTKNAPPIVRNEHMADAIAVIYAYATKNLKHSFEGSI